MFRTVALYTCVGLPLMGLVSGPSSAADQTLSMMPPGPELTDPSVNPYSNSFTTTKKNEGIGGYGMFYFTLTSPETVSISFSGFTVSDVKNNPDPTIGGAVLSLCDVLCQSEWADKTQPAAVNIQVADYILPGTGTPQTIAASQQTEYFSSAGWVLPANTGGAVYELCFDGIQTNKGTNSYTGNVTITGAPEASSWAMMLLGFSGLGFLGSLARKKKGADALGV